MDDNKLDKLFQNKLGPESERTFEFKEQYWQDAEFLINKDQKKKRRYLWLWLLLEVLIIIGVFFIYLSDPIELIREKQQFQSQTPRFENSEQNLNLTETSGEETNTASDEKIIDKTLNEENKSSFNLESNKNNSINTEDVKEEIERKKDVSKVNSTTPWGSENQIFNNKEGIKESLKEQVETLKQEDAEKTNEYQLDKEKPKVIALQSITKQKSITRLKSFPIFLNPYTSLNKGLIPASFPEGDPSKEKNKRWTLYASGLYQKAVTFNGFDDISTDLKGGMELEYKLSPRFNLNTGLFFRNHESFFSTSASSVQTNYSFGKDESTFYLQPTDLEYLDLNLGSSYRLINGKFLVSLSIGRLIGAKGRIIEQDQRFPWERTEGENLNFQSMIIAQQMAGAETNNLIFAREITSSKTRIATTGIDKWRASLFVEYRYPVFRNIDFGLGTEIPFSKPNVEALRKSVVNFQLSLTYRLIKF